MRAGIGRLLKLFASSTRPAAIALLSGYLNESDSVMKVRSIIQRFMEETQTGSDRIRKFECPLRRIQDHIRTWVRYVIAINSVKLLLTVQAPIRSTKPYSTDLTTPAM